MDIKRSGSQPSGKPPADYFTGTVRIDPLNSPPEPARVASLSCSTAQPGAPATVPQGRRRKDVEKLVISRIHCDQLAVELVASSVNAMPFSRATPLISSVGGLPRGPMTLRKRHTRPKSDQAVCS